MKRVVRLQTIADAVESWHPRGCQVAILQQHPVTSPASRGYGGLSDWALTLTQRNVVKPTVNAVGVGKAHQLFHWVRPARENEEERDLAC